MTENRCFKCHEIGHWRHNCPKHRETGINASGIRDCLDLSLSLVSLQSQPRSQARSEAPRSTHEIGGTSGANVGQQPAEWTAYSGYQDLSNRLSEMSLSYGCHHQHMEYNTVEALHQANWQSGVMNQMASHFGIQSNTTYAPSPYWP
ncbi:hypothetical protein OSB04_031910 [Centaurea solstitialis]|uniref:CCHC-type domain-containing protein n=1 Tax=Centaurea solstitialis TaxID=347529 RepID=A0AA38VY17_9ASTR|nr:hypothetical protein OSB04_031910 [Centaurea solstitialis]